MQPYIERAPRAELVGLVRTVWIQRTGGTAYVQHHLPTGGVELAMGGAYNRVAASATAFAHRGERFLLEHIAQTPGTWVDRSWAIAHADGSGRVYPNFPDPQLGDWAMAYHAGNYPGWPRSRRPTTPAACSLFLNPSIQPPHYPGRSDPRPRRARFSRTCRPGGVVNVLLPFG